jgi:DNA invertase Pin-like site-specific DNA recombinase
LQAEKRQAAIYCRVASASEFALESQRRSLYNFAESIGFDVAAEYLDNGANGLTFDRPAFSKLNDDMLAGRIQSLIVLNSSRIGRDSLIVYKWLCKVRNLGVVVISEYDDIQTVSSALSTRGLYFPNTRQPSIKTALFCGMQLRRQRKRKTHNWRGK